MIDLTPLDVRKKKGDFRRSVRGYDPELVDDFLDMVAERLEELVKQNVGLTERAEHLQEQVASNREREKALNDALVTAQQLRAEAQAQAEREAELVRREAQSQAERIVEEGQRSLREIVRETETLHARRRQFVRSFRTMLERFLADLDVEDAGIREEGVDMARSVKVARAERPSGAPSDQPPRQTEASRETEPSGRVEEKKRSDPWLSTLVGEGEQEQQD